jgi:hypothetical protein
MRGEGKRLREREGIAKKKPGNVESSDKQEKIKERNMTNKEQRYKRKRMILYSSEEKHECTGKKDKRG